MHHDLNVLQRLRLNLPTAHGRRPASQKVGQAGLIVAGVLWVDFCEAPGHGLRYRRVVTRIELDVGIALGMDIPLGPVYTDRSFKEAYMIRHLEITIFTYLHARIVGTMLQHE